MATSAPLQIATTHLRLKPDGLAELLPVTPELWPNIMSGKLGDFHNEFLISLFTFQESWPTWECHPHGDEIVLLLSGAADFVLDLPDGEQVLQIRAAGEYAFVPKGTWHTLNVVDPPTMLFITAGEGTEIKPRS